MKINKILFDHPTKLPGNPDVGPSFILQNHNFTFYIA